MKTILTAQLTENYYQKSKPLFDSIKHNWKGEFLPVFVGFKPVTEFKYFYADIERVATYRSDYPLNRKNYVCLQAGEFLDFIPDTLIDDDDIIIQIDSDTIMQRSFTAEELKQIIPGTDEIISVQSSNPASTLAKVANYPCFHKNISIL